MEKDISLSGLQYEFSSQEPEGLIDELADQCRRFDQQSLLSNFLYRVDLKHEFDSVADYSLLASKLWNRVTQKVWFRKIYRKNKLDK